MPFGPFGPHGPFGVQGPDTWTISRQGDVVIMGRVNQIPCLLGRKNCSRSSRCRRKPSDLHPGQQRHGTPWKSANRPSPSPQRRNRPRRGRANRLRRHQDDARGGAPDEEVSSDDEARKPAAKRNSPCRAVQGRQHPFRPNRRFRPVPAGSYPRRGLRFSGLLSRLRHYRRSFFRGLLRHVSTFLRPFAPGPLPALLRSYGRSDSCSPGSSALLGHELRLLHEQVSLIHAPGLPTLPSPTTCGCFVSSGHVAHRRIEPRLLPHGSSPNGNSRLRLSAADSPHHTGRIEFLIVRTSGSPPAAPHPVSPRRSCSRLQVTLTWRGLAPLQPGALSGALPRASSPCSYRRASPVNMHGQDGRGAFIPSRGHERTSSDCTSRIKS